jgi:predicted nucleotidyltransferase
MAYTIDDIRTIVGPIASRFGVERVWMFGSYARGEATPASDADLRSAKARSRDISSLGPYISLRRRP